MPSLSLLHCWRSSGLQIFNLLSGLLLMTCTFMRISAAPATLPSPALQPVVEIEEEVYKYTSANNGAGPLWCSGSSCLVRIGDRVFASGIETLENVKPL